MSDITGKSGVGKRVLDDHGNWRAVTSLPAPVQEEIRQSQKVAAAQFKEKALRHNKEYQDLKAQEVEKNLKAENDDLKSLVQTQGEMLAKINAKMELGATVKADRIRGLEVGNAIIADPIPEPAPIPKPLTPKQKLMKEAEELGVDYDESMTKAEITELIEEAKTEDAIKDL